MPKLLHNILMITIVIAGLVLVTALQFGAIPHSVRGWAALIFIGAPLLVIGEGFGELFAGFRLFSLSPAPIRIAFGVLAGCAFMALSYYPARYVISLMQTP